MTTHYRPEKRLPPRLHTPISQGFAATGGVARMSMIELDAFARIMRWAADGCLHENYSALGAQLAQDAAWLEAEYSARVARGMGYQMPPRRPARPGRRA
jgi:hypothetical protein